MNPRISAYRAKKLNTYILLMHKNNLGNVHLMAYITFLHLKDKKLKQAVRGLIDSDVMKITMSLLSLTLSETYPVIR